MRKWTYTGNISEFSTKRNRDGEPIITEIILDDIYDNSKAPVLLKVSPALTPYIIDLEWNDDEERYMKKEFVYDDTLYITKIRILNKDGAVCKIIREYDDRKRIAEITGPVKRITSGSQKALDADAETVLVNEGYFKA